MKKHVWLSLLLVLVLTLGCLAAANAEILPPYGEGQIGLTAVAMGDKLEMRKDPKDDAEVVLTLEGGDLILVTGVEGDWARVVRSDSEDAPAGWVRNDFILTDPSWFRAEGETLVHAWNDAAALKVWKLQKDDIVPVLKTEGDWALVLLGTGVGWVFLGK